MTKRTTGQMKSLIMNSFCRWRWDCNLAPDSKRIGQRYFPPFFV